MDSKSLASKKRITDITAEVFNYCDGGCSGCALSALERGNFSQIISAEEFDLLAESVSRYGSECDLTFRILLVFGDVPLLGAKKLQEYVDACRKRNLFFGMTVTLANNEANDVYNECLDVIRGLNGSIVDLTLDPFRYRAQSAYRERVGQWLHSVPNKHVQVQMSDAILKKITPEELSNIIQEGSPDGVGLISFTPSRSNLFYKQYKYDISAAVSYANKFYRETETGIRFSERELVRFNGKGDYKMFAKQAFHIGKGLNCYPVVYTMFGDVILDERNGFKEIGTLKEASLSDILSSKQIEMLDMKNRVALFDNKYGCEECQWADSCVFNGVGIARKIYMNFDEKKFFCYGPRDFLG